MFDLVSPLLFGLVGSVHCLGMCGPLVLAYSLHLRPGEAAKRPGFFPEGAAHHLAFHGGRLLTYGMLGGLAAGIIGIPAFHQVFEALRSGVSVGGGILMLLFGFSLIGSRTAGISSLSLPGSARIMGRAYRTLLTSKGLLPKAALGLLSGFLPCMLSFIMVVKAAATGSVLSGFLTMLLFGAGTVPILFFTGVSASHFSFKARILGERVAGGMVMAMGVMLILRGGKHFL
jgi:sulfite exporter TauE/SafE